MPNLKVTALDSLESHRTEDVNGYVEIRDNPITKVGVFPYSGGQIDPSGELGLDPNKIYQVYRSEEALNNEETINSFKLSPWIVEHEMLGDGKYGTTQVGKKQVYGVTGEGIYFKYPYLYGNLKSFSKKLSENEKKELSIGYRCVYHIKSGNFNGKHYEVVQENILGNHLASVEEGRAGPDVKVLDKSTFTYDSKDGVKMVQLPENDEAMKPSEDTESAELQENKILKEILISIKNLAEKLDGKFSKDEEETKVEDEDEEKEKVEDEEEKTEDEKDPKITEAKDSVFKKKNVAMDAAALYKGFEKTLAVKNEMVEKLKPLIGGFDSIGFSIKDVAKYGLDSLKVKYQKGEEVATMNGYLAATKKKPAESKYAMDSIVSNKNTSIQKFLQGVK